MIIKWMSMMLFKETKTETTVTSMLVTSSEQSQNLQLHLDSDFITIQIFVKILFIYH